MQGIFDLGSNVLPVRVTTSASKTSTVTGTTVDCAEFNALMFLIYVDAVTTLDATDYFTFTDQTGADYGGSDKESVQSTSYQYGTQCTTAGLTNAVSWPSPYVIGKVSGTAAANQTYGVGVSLFDSFNTTVNSNRYHTAVLTATGSPSAVLGITALLATGVHSPVLNPATV